MFFSLFSHYSLPGKCEGVVFVYEWLRDFLEERLGARKRRRDKLV
jgi:hypothetical protein